MIGENVEMSALLDEAGEIRWRAVLEQLESGTVVEIGCVSERDFVRRTAQATKRAEKQGLTIQVERTATAIRIVPASVASVAMTRGGDRRDAAGKEKPERAKPHKAVAAR